MTPRRDGESNRKSDDTSRKNCRPPIRACRRTTDYITNAGKAPGLGAVLKGIGADSIANPGTINLGTRIRRAVAGTTTAADNRHDADRRIAGDEDMAPSTQRIRERVGDHERSARPDSLMASSVPQGGGICATDPDPSPPIRRAPVDAAPGKSSVLSIREKMAAAAKALRDKPCPAGLCDHCYRHACRLLNIGCCICTGHIDPTDKQKFLQ